jgi:hypothetical protein
MSNATLWFSPADYRLASPGLSFVDTSGPRTVEIAVAGSAAGQWLVLPLTLPPGTAVAQLDLCYRVSDKRTAINQIRITGLKEPAAGVALFRDAGKHNSDVPVCETFDVRAMGKPLPGTLALTLELQLDFGGMDTVTLGGVRCEIVAEDCCGCSKAANEHVLSEYYRPPTPDAKTALNDGFTDILAHNGGFLCIPADAITAGFIPHNKTGSKELDVNRTDFDSVTVVDQRKGVERRYLPPAGVPNSELTTFAGQILERDLATDLGWQGSYAVESLCSRLQGGGSSVSMNLSQKTSSGGNRFYVPSHMGFFPGQKLKINLLDDLFTVDALGEDATGKFFDTKETAKVDIPQFAPVYNKHNVGVLAVSDTSNSDNQGVSITVNRRAYGAGDIFMMGAILEYQSNVYSGLGDEGAVGCAVNLLHDLESFRGKVESWTTTPGHGESELVYKTTAAASGTINSQKLGTSRPLINLKGDKWKFDGSANVIPPNVDSTGWLDMLPSPPHLNGCILIRSGPVADWTKYKGSFIALLGRPGTPDDLDHTDASEFYKKDELTPLGKVSDNVYRWWYITEVKDAGTVAGVSRAYFFVDRPNQRSSDVATSGPLLFREINVTESKAQVDTRTLRYIIAPGAWVSDVRNGVAGNVLGNEGAQPSDARKIVLAPGHPDLVADDPITNPPGADVLQPSGFRVRHVHQYPAFGPGASFVSENLGRVQVGNGLFIGGTVIPDPGETIPDAIKRVQKDQRPLYINGALIAAPTDTAIRVEAYTERAAVELFQLDCDQDIVWWSSDYSNRSSLHRDRTSGDFVFTSYMNRDFAAPNLTGPGGISLTKLSGISSTSTAARNVCGFQTVEATKSDASVQFPMEKPEPDRKYHVFIQCNWHTRSAVVTRLETGFSVTFSDTAPANAGFDWLLVR